MFSVNWCLIFIIDLFFVYCCCRFIGEYFLPSPNKLPRTYRELSAILKEIGMEYQSIHACPNDHIIYYGQYASETNCPQCQFSRYWPDQLTKKVPHKVLHYIPIIPRLQRLFRCRNIAQFMDYHARNRSEDDFLRMPADGSLYKILKKDGQFLKKNLVILGFHWQLTV